MCAPETICGLLKSYRGLVIVQAKAGWGAEGVPLSNNADKRCAHLMKTDGAMLVHASVTHMAETLDATSRKK